MRDVLDHDVQHSKTLELSERASEDVKRRKSQQEHSDVMGEEISVGAAADDDDDSCLKLDLRGLDENVAPPAPQSPVFAVDSARTLADIPEDYLMSASARSTAGDELVEACTQPIPASPQPDAVHVPPSLHTASVASQSANVNYSEDFSAAAVSRSRVEMSQRSDMSKTSPKNDESSEESVKTETVKTEHDIDEALSEDEVLTSPIRSIHDDLSLPASDKATDTSLSKFATPAEDVAGKYYCATVDNTTVLCALERFNWLMVIGILENLGWKKDGQ